jgi:hypothetical protein
MTSKTAERSASAIFSLPISLARRKNAQHANLLPNYLSQRFIDPFLPARSGFLKVIKNIAVNSQRDQLLGTGDGRALRREFRGFRGCRLERRFRDIP